MKRFPLLLALGALAGGCASAPAPQPTRTPPPTPPPAAVQTVLQPSAANPLVSIRLVFRTGSVDDPAGKEGLAALTARLIGEGGSAARAYAEVLDRLYPMAAAIEVQVTRELTVVHGTVHRDNLDAYTELLLAQVLTPRFDPSDLARLRERQHTHLTKTLRSEDDEELGKAALHLAMYEGHPYARPVAGTVQGLAAITLADIQAFKAAKLTRSRLILGIAGGYPAGYPQAVLRRLEGLPVGDAALAPVPAVAREAGREVLLIRKETPAVALSLGHPLAVTRADDDFYALAVAASYLGEHRTFNGVLMQNMRGKRGLNYGDYAYVEAFIQQGWGTFPLPNIARRQQHFEIWIRPVAPKNAAFALRQALYETDKLIREGIPAQAFEDTRRFLLAYQQLWTQDASRRLGYAIDARLYGRDVQAELARRLPRLTKADVDAAIRKHLSARDLKIAIVAKDAEGLREVLASGAPTPISYDTEGTPAEVLAEDAKIAPYPLDLSQDQIAIRPAADLFAR